MDKITFIEYYTDLLTEAEKVHTVMVEIPKFKELMDYIASIPEEIVYEPKNPEYGKEKNPHVTVLYGIDKMEGEKAKTLLRKIPASITATLGTITRFEGQLFDVLKIDVTSPYLTRINKFLRDTVEYKNDHPNYHPHVTLCYLKKGMGKEFEGDARFSGMKFAFKTFLYSDEFRNKENVPMKAETPPTEIKEYGAGGGYGGAPGGSIAATGWGATPNSPQALGRTKSYDAGRTSYMQGNTVVNNSLYDTLRPEDLKHPKFTSDEMMLGYRIEMKRMEFPDKTRARPIIIHNLEKNPKYYSDLGMYNITGG